MTILSGQSLVFFVLLFYLYNKIEQAEGTCLMYGQCNEKQGVLTDSIYQNCLTNGTAPKRLSELNNPEFETVLKELKEMCPEVFPPGDDGKKTIQNLN